MATAAARRINDGEVILMVRIGDVTGYPRNGRFSMDFFADVEICLPATL